MEGSSSTTRRRYGKFAMPTPPFLHWVRACPSLDPNRQAALPSVQNCTLSAILGQHCLNPPDARPPARLRCASAAAALFALPAGLRLIAIKARPRYPTGYIEMLIAMPTPGYRVSYK